MKEKYFERTRKSSFFNIQSSIVLYNSCKKCTAFLSTMSKGWISKFLDYYSLNANIQKFKKLPESFWSHIHCPAASSRVVFKLEFKKELKMGKGEGIKLVLDSGLMIFLRFSKHIL